MEKNVVEKFSLEKINFEGEMNLSIPEIRDLIANVEKFLMEFGEKVEIEPAHYFSKAVYAREIFIPKGTLIVGKIHRHQNLNIISKGDVSVFSIDGKFRFKAPHTLVASPGVKRMIYAHEDTVWTTIHGTDETDLEKIEDEFIAKNYDEFLIHEKKEILSMEDKPCLG